MKTSERAQYRTQFRLNLNLKIVPRHKGDSIHTFQWD